MLITNQLRIKTITMHNAFINTMKNIQARFESIIDNIENGNRSDARTQINRLSKLELLDMIENHYWLATPRHNRINTLRSILE